MDVKDDDMSLQLNTSAKEINPISIWRTKTDICQLNDDCLIGILKYLDIVDQFNFARSSDRFFDAFILCVRSYRTKFDVDFYKFKYLRNEEQKELLSLVGTHIKLVTIAEAENSSTLELLCTFCPNVSSLTLCKSPAQLIQFVNSMQMITELHLHKKCYTVDLDILTLKKLPLLKKLTVCSGTISGKYFSELKNLQFLNLSESVRLESEYLIELLTALVDLQTLNIMRCSGINVNVCKQMVQYSIKLESLQIDPRGSGFEIIARLPSLKYLELSLESIHYSIPENVAKIFNEMANHADQLQHLKLVGKTVIVESPLMLDCIRNLKVLHCDIRQNPQFDIDFNDEWLKRFSKMESLEKLTIECQAMKIKDGLLYLVANCKRLNHVEIQTTFFSRINDTAKFVRRMILILRNKVQGRILPFTLILGDVEQLTTGPSYYKAVEDGIINIKFSIAKNTDTDYDDSMDEDSDDCYHYNKRYDNSDRDNFNYFDYFKNDDDSDESEYDSDSDD